MATVIVHSSQRTKGPWRMYMLEHTHGPLASNPERFFIHIDSSDFGAEFRMSGFMKPLDAAIVRCAPESYELAEQIVRAFETTKIVPPFVEAARQLLRRMQDTSMPLLRSYLEAGQTE